MGGTKSRYSRSLEWGNALKALSFRVVVDVELTPPQAPEVAALVVETLAEPRPEPDPWWFEGLQEQLSA